MQLEDSPALAANPANLADQKTASLEDARLNIDAVAFPDLYNKTPFPFTHNLNTLKVFEFDSLCELAEKFAHVKSEYNIAGSALAPDAGAAPVSRFGLKPIEVLQQLDEKPLRLLLKRPERQDERFRKLLDLLFQQISQLRGGIGSERIVRLESAILISSAAATTPLHFDPEIGFFSQIEGDKIYHVYSPNDVSEDDLERFYVRDMISTCRLELKHRNPENEHVYYLSAGKGFHQPQNSPHWVETCKTRSISYTCVFETNATRARGRTRAFNYYERKIGLRPASPGMHAQMDALKANASLPELITRKVVRRVLTKVRGE
jgi:hypothetical protein